MADLPLQPSSLDPAVPLLGDGGDALAPALGLGLSRQSDAGQGARKVHHLQKSTINKPLTTRFPRRCFLSFPFPSVLRPQLFISQAHQLFFPSCHRLLHPKTDTPSLSVSSGPVALVPSSVLRASHVCVDSFHSRSVPAATASLLSSRATPFSNPFVGSFIPVVCPLPAQRINSHPIRKKSLTNCLTP